jgi:hypothetical protein
MMGSERRDFVMRACLEMVHAVDNDGARRKHVETVKATAEALADVLGLEEDPGQYDHATLNRDAIEQLGRRTRELLEAKDRIAELERERELEAATAPIKQAASGRGSR